ncbi:hypothetical protein PROFUN_07395 [Planoprotostelium fungivorum]|uniref:Uncharacterized protein n=1 Tax=Planoprotostelium fungivorum TaxID=1890364 RepID=A0A2P6MTG0_9EUKA|nr:hypothetical protein PROFUN_07395 [Planoprotostelium fungivorum]
MAALQEEIVYRSLKSPASESFRRGCRVARGSAPTEKSQIVPRRQKVITVIWSHPGTLTGKIRRLYNRFNPTTE